MAASPVFRAMLSSGMIEQQKNEINLPEDPARGFQHLVNWIYNAQLFQDPTKSPTEEALSRAQGWQLADKHGIPDLQNLLMDWLREHWDYYLIHPQFLSWASRNTLSTSQLQRFILDQLAYCLATWEEEYQPTAKDQTASTENADFQETAPQALENVLATPEISAKLFWAVKRLDRGAIKPTTLEGCHYHVHADGESCQSKSTFSKKN